MCDLPRPIYVTVNAIAGRGGVINAPLASIVLWIGVFRLGAITIGLIASLGRFDGSSSTMSNHIELIQQVEHVSFAMLWVSKFRFLTCYFGDNGQFLHGPISDTLLSAPRT